MPIKCPDCKEIHLDYLGHEDVSIIPRGYTKCLKCGAVKPDKEFKEIKT